MFKATILQPAAYLGHLVSHVQVVEQRSDNLQQQHEKIITGLPFYADGLPGIVFHQTEGGMYLNKQGRKLSPLFLYGQTITPITLLPTGNFRMIVFLLYSSSVSRLFGIRSNEVTDDCVDLRLLPTSGLLSDYDALTETDDCNLQIEIISRYLQKISASVNPATDNIIHYALEHIIASNGQTSLSNLRKHLNVTERTFERKFDQHVGVSPRLFSRICQFRSTLRQLEDQNFGKLSDVAYHNGFADQSHFIRTFRQFTGLSPLEYLRKGAM